MRKILLMVGLLVGSLAGAQERSAALPVAEQPTGTVTGLVIAQDTQRPVRLAMVQLQRVVPESGALQNGFGGGPVNVRTDFDGTFTAVHVVVGDYYVTASASGYVSMNTLLRAKIAAGADAAALLAALPQVHVTADSSSNVTVSIQRGGAISGHVEWEDGTPASGINITGVPLVIIPQPAALRGISFANPPQPAGQTDDHGNFRLAGIPTGEFVLMATLQTGMQTGGFGRPGGFVSPIYVFNPGVFRKAAAKAVSVRAGDERTDVRIVIDLRGLHTVSGHANSANQGETVARGSVQLIDSSDSTANMYGQIDADGSFKLRYVASGTYTLRISGANSQAQSFGRPRDGGAQLKGVAYQEFSTTITVSDTDVTGVAVSLVPVQGQK